MLARLDKRFSHRFQLTASYALAANHGYGSISNFDNYAESYGPQGSRHTLTVSGVVDLPWGFQIGLISSMATSGPVNATVTNVDLNGDGNTTEILPGLTYNCINRSCGPAQIQAAVDNWNNNYAGKKDARGQTILSDRSAANLLPRALLRLAGSAPHEEVQVRRALFDVPVR